MYVRHKRFIIEIRVERDVPPCASVEAQKNLMLLRLLPKDEDSGSVDLFVKESIPGPRPSFLYHIFKEHEQLASSCRS